MDMTYHRNTDNENKTTRRQPSYKSSAQHRCIYHKGKIQHTLQQSAITQSQVLKQNEKET